MTIVVIKLITSAEVVGKISDATHLLDSQQNIILEDPKGVVAARGNDGSISWNLAPFMISSPESVANIRSEHVVAWAEADGALTEVYTKLTSKIQLAGLDSPFAGVK